MTIVYPQCVRYQNELALAAANCKAAGVTFDGSILEKVTRLVQSLVQKISALEHYLPSNGGHGVANPKEAAIHCFRDVKPAIQAVREIVDELEGVVADDYWPLPTYQEMLFIK
jgi:glutamine synthetase